MAGSPGDVAVVNLTPVEAEGWGNGELVSSDVVSPPVASNVNFSPGSFDPNVAFAPYLGADGTVCFVNSAHTSVDLVADHLGTIEAAAFTFAGSGRCGAAHRRHEGRDRRHEGGVRPVGCASRWGGSPGDVAVVNLTPVEAEGWGNGGAGVVGCGVAAGGVEREFLAGFVRSECGVGLLARSGQRMGRVLFREQRAYARDSVVDHLGDDLRASASFRSGGCAGAGGGHGVGLGGARVGPSGRSCFPAVGSPGDVAVVNLTPVNAAGLGNGQLVSSYVVSPLVASNVNFSPGSFDPNVALAPIGADGRVRFVNSVDTSVNRPRMIWVCIGPARSRSPPPTARRAQSSTPVRRRAARSDKGGQHESNVRALRGERRGGVRDRSGGRPRCWDHRSRPRRATPERLLNSVTRGVQIAPDVAAMPDGRVYAVWSDEDALEFGWIGGRGVRSAHRGRRQPGRPGVRPDDRA